MKVDIQFMFGRAEVRAMAQDLTIFNEHIYDVDDEQVLVVVQPVGPFVFRDRDIVARQIEELQKQVQTHYTNLWVRGHNKLEPTGDFRFNPQDWKASRVNISNVCYTAFPTGTHDFGPSTTNL